MPRCNDGALVRVRGQDRNGMKALVMRYYNRVGGEPMLSSLTWILDELELREMDDRLRADNDHFNQLPRLRDE